MYVRSSLTRTLWYLRTKSISLGPSQFLSLTSRKLRPSTLIPKDLTFWARWTVHFHRPFTCIYNLQPSCLWNIQFRRPTTSSLLEPTSFISKVIWSSTFGPFTLTLLDRSIWSKTVHFRLDPWNWMVIKHSVFIVLCQNAQWVTNYCLVIIYLLTTTIKTIFQDF